MKRCLNEKLNALFAYPYFQAVGGGLPNVVTSVSGWKAVLAAGNMLKWENCRLMARNALYRAVQARAWSRSECWNSLAEELRPQIVRFVDGFVPSLKVPADVLHRIRPAVSWDLMLICFEFEYRDVVDPIFYIPVLEPWYAGGHFPCGWDGEEFPDRWDGIIRNGKLIVY
jgi:hypothetical protein